MKNCRECNYPNPDDRTTCSQCGAELVPSPAHADHFVDRLESEVKEWQDERIINADQGKMLLARYGLIPNETAGTLHRSKIASIIAVLGVILFGIGIILIMGANWEDMPKWLRLGILMGSTAATYIGGYKLAYESRSYNKIGTALLLLGSVLWGTSILLIGQMFSLGGEGGERKAILYWCIGVLPLAYVLKSPLHMGLSALIWSIWFVWQLTDSQPHTTTSIFTEIMAMGALLAGLGIVHAIWKPVKELAVPLRNLGLAGIFVPLYAYSFRFFWDDAAYHGIHSGQQFPITVSILAGLVLAAGMCLALWRRQKANIYESAGLLILFVISTALVLSQLSGMFGPPTHHSYGESSGHLGLALIFNLVLLAGEIGVIALGWYRNRPGLINFGLAFFVVQVVTRYIDTLSSMLGGGMVFILAGLILIPMAIVIERTRRRLLATAVGRRTV